jgi:probable HAF family extracellular repeat protein
MEQPISFHAFRTSANVNLTDQDDLGTLGTGTFSEAHGINALGQTVGSSTFESGQQIYGISHAFFVDVTGPMLDLNDLIPSDSGWELQSATGINDSGQIVGNGRAPNGENHAFLLTLTPEPTSMSMFALGSLRVLARRRRRSRTR